jgi:uncharacterized protein (TIGR02246 family)
MSAAKSSKAKSSKTKPRGAKDVVLAFVDAVNSGDPEKIAELLSEDHLFVDSGGRAVEGRDAMREAWTGYLAMVPDYTLTVDEVIASRNLVVLLGSAEGTFAEGGKLRPENHWETPGAWKAVVRRGQISEWRVFSDNGPIREIMQRAAERSREE